MSSARCNLHECEKCAPAVFQRDDRHVANRRNRRVATRTGSDLGEIVGTHTAVDRLVFGAFAVMSFDCEPPLAAVPEHLEQHVQRLEGGGFGGCRRVDDEVFAVVMCAATYLVAPGIQGLSLRRTDV